MAPFLEFRNWLAKIRNEPSLRWGTRRNGKAGLGPFTLSARVDILYKIRELENITKSEIVSIEEENEIVRLWKLDKEIDSTVDLNAFLKNRLKNGNPLHQPANSELDVPIA